MTETDVIAFRNAEAAGMSMVFDDIEAVAQYFDDRARYATVLSLATRSKKSSATYHAEAKTWATAANVLRTSKIGA